MVHYISLGNDCLPKILLRTCGFVQSKAEGELTSVFDLCVTPYEAVCHCLRRGFEQYLDKSQFEIVDAKDSTLPEHEQNGEYDGMIVNRVFSNVCTSKYKLYWTHETKHLESDIDYVCDDYKALIDRYTSRISVFQDRMNNLSEPGVMFIMHVKRDYIPNGVVPEMFYPTELVEYLKETVEVPFTVVVLSTDIAFDADKSDEIVKFHSILVDGDWIPHRDTSEFKERFRCIIDAESASLFGVRDMRSQLLRFPEVLGDDKIKSNQFWDVSSFVQTKARMSGRIVVGGMGGSAIAADVVKSFTKHRVDVVRDYDLSMCTPPVSRWDVVILCSYSGNTEETISMYKDAMTKGCDIVCVTTGGKLQRMAEDDNQTVVYLTPGMQPRAAFPCMYATLKAIVSLNGKCNIDAMKKARDSFFVNGGMPKTIAKEVFKHSQVFIYTDAAFNNVGTRFRNQLNENAKMLASSNVFPEACHNEIVGYQRSTRDALGVFIIDRECDDRVKERMTFCAGLMDNSYVIYTPEEYDDLETKVLFMIYLLDIASYEVAMLNGSDACEVKNIDCLKKHMGRYEDLQN